MLVGLNDSTMTEILPVRQHHRDDLKDSTLNLSSPDPRLVESLLNSSRGGPVPSEVVRKSRIDAQMEDPASKKRSRSRDREENPERDEESKSDDKEALNQSSIFKVPIPSERDYEPSVIEDDQKMDEQKSRYEELTPYSYQTDIYAKIKENWRNERRFGNIVFLETGTGKTYIAIMLLKAIFGEDLEARGLSDAEMCAQAKTTEEGATLKPLSSKEIENKYSERL
jgi:hypothetical protein